MEDSRYNKIYGVFLLVLGAALAYNSVLAIHNYFQTGFISWGRSPRQATGETALLFHGIMVLAGACCSGYGVSQILGIYKSRA